MASSSGAIYLNGQPTPLRHWAMRSIRCHLRLLKECPPTSLLELDPIHVGFVVRISIHVLAVKRATASQRQ